MTDHRVNIAHHAVEKEGGVIVTAGLGSCVAIAIHDPAAFARIAELVRASIPAAAS